MGSSQKGFVSIIVAAILMILLSLVTIGFSQLMQREQRQALDRQLSSQAFYAAETAVNDVYDDISSGTVVEKADCAANGDYDGVVDGAEPGVEYTCLLIDPSPETLEYDNNKIGTQSSKVIPLNTESGNDFEEITFSWNGDGANYLSNDCTISPLVLPTTLESDEVPILRLDITPVEVLDRPSLIANTRAIFLYPCASSGTNSINLSSIQTGEIQEVNCGSTPYSCNVSFNNLSGPFAVSNYMVRVKAIGNSAQNLRISGRDTGGVASFEGAQTVVDSTGKANDVVRRVKVRLSNTPSYAFPEYVLQAFDGVCKQISIASPDFVDYDCY